MQLSSRAQPCFSFLSVLNRDLIRSDREPTVAVLLLLAPHPSILHVLLNYHYLTLHAPLYFVAHLLVIYALSFLAFSSLIACVVRDPGPIPEAKSEDPHDVGGGGGRAGDEISIEDALLSTAPPSSSDDYTQPGRWCRICWKPKPERAHHCSQCGRCVLKMGAWPFVPTTSVCL
jgi:palmitoyltransferase